MSSQVAHLMQMICRVCPQPGSLLHTQTSSGLSALSSFSSPEGTEVAHFESSQSALRCGEAGGEQVRSRNVICCGSGSLRQLEEVGFWGTHGEGWGKGMGGWGRGILPMHIACSGPPEASSGKSEAHGSWVGPPGQQLRREGTQPAAGSSGGSRHAPPPSPPRVFPLLRTGLSCAGEQGGREAASPNTTSLGRTNVKI